MSEPLPAADLIQQGLFHHHRGELDLAMQRYSDVLRVDPANAEALYYVAVIACQEEQFKQGIELAEKALAAGPPQARVHNLLGKAHERLGEHLEAIKAFDAAVALEPGFAEAYGNRAALLAAAGLPEEALKSFDRALALDPAAVPDWVNRGALLQGLERHAEALASYDKALALSPNDAGIQVNRANALAMLSRFAEAEHAYDRALALNPKLSIAHAHKGLAVKHQGRFAEARTLMQQALTLQPGDHATAFGLAQLMLLTGDWRPAWPLFERRASLPRPAYAPLEGERWQGQIPADFRLVLLAEQGLGDTVHFSRYAALFAARRYDVTLLAPPVLAPLMRTLPRVERVASSVEELADDKRRYMWLPLLSSMGMLHLTADTVPAQQPYLAAEPERAARWRERLGAGFKVGLVWRGATRDSAAPLAALSPLAELAGVRLISLQKGEAAAEWAHVSFGGRLERPLAANDLGAEALLDTAAVMANLDLVVSIDSMPAHLAGALGRPVFLALPFVPDWRWLTERDDTIWYPSMRLFRQDQSRQWRPVFERMAAALRDLSASQA
jgi:tetratricopeptide (TPR) repeat protein